MEPFTISVLLTKAEYTAEAGRGARRVGVLTPLGMLIFLAGLVCRLWNLWGDLPAGSLMLLGVLLVVAEMLLFPLAAQFRAAARYDATPPEAVTLQFGAEAVTVKGSRVEGTLPYTLLTAKSESDTLFCLQFGGVYTAYIPRRLLTDRQWQMLRDL